jgi:hypothetical protein
MQAKGYFSADGREQGERGGPWGGGSLAMLDCCPMPRARTLLRQLPAPDLRTAATLVAVARTKATAEARGVWP